MWHSWGSPLEFYTSTYLQNAFKELIFSLSLFIFPFKFFKIALKNSVTSTVFGLYKEVEDWPL